MHIKDTPLDHANTMALSCQVAQLVTVTTETAITDFLKQFLSRLSRNNTTNLLILSGGSNVLLPKKLDACVLMPKLKGISDVTDEFITKDNKNSNDTVFIAVMAGENWHDWVMYSIQQGWYGLENLALIPGLVGAAPVQNIGAYGVALSDVFEQLEAINLSTNQKKIFTQAECQFAYRDSVFKQNPNQWLITKVVFKLSRQSNLKMGYGDVEKLAQQLCDVDNSNNTENNKPTSRTNHITPKHVADAIIQIRQSKLPDPKKIANTGSFFKNPVVNQTVFATLKKQYPDMPHYPQADGQIKLAAGWLIDKAGLKGFQLGDIATHKKQALVIVNHAPYVSIQDDIKQLSDYIQNKVMQTFSVQLEREPVWVNADGSTC